jgi:hypothetical protein
MQLYLNTINGQKIKAMKKFLFLRLQPSSFQVFHLHRTVTEKNVVREQNKQAVKNLRKERKNLPPKKLSVINN